MSAEPVALANAAAETIRALNHTTGPASAVLHPADAADIVAALATTARRMPQLLTQLDAHLTRQEGRLRLDTMAPARSVAEAVTAITAALTASARAARAAGAALHDAHQLLAHLATTTIDTDCEETTLT